MLHTVESSQQDPSPATPLQASPLDPFDKYALAQTILAKIEGCQSIKDRIRLEATLNATTGYGTRLNEHGKYDLVPLKVVLLPSPSH